MKENKTKYIFISGGVISGIGKGITSASLGRLLKDRGYNVGAVKSETYLNIDSGTINPIEHGDPFLCNDGLEADMDLGTYERFLEIDVGYKNFITMGQIYKTIIDNERNMVYGGKTVDAIPIIPTEIIRRIKEAGSSYEICMVELGGTAGEYQNIYNYEAARLMKLESPQDVVHIHLSYVPVPPHLGEPKTKPTQLSIRFLNMAGIQPEFLVLRSSNDIDDKRMEKVAVQCNLHKDSIIKNLNLKSVYQLPNSFKEQNFDVKVLKNLNLPVKKINFKAWDNLVKIVTKQRKNRVKITIAGKYIATGKYELPDAYNSLIHAVKHASWHTGIGVDINFVNTEEIEKSGANKFLKDSDGIIVPIGWGKRGVEGKISAINFSRTKKVPYLGLCYGMQLAAVEYSRNLLKWQDASSEEIDPKSSHLIVHSIPFDSKYQKIKGKDVSMRLGAFDCVIKKDTLAYKIYSKYPNFVLKKNKDGSIIVSERHRHRFEFNNVYRKTLEEKGIVFSGASPDNFFVEMIELSQNVHPFFFATQAHPEYKSKPLKAHPVFIEFIKACWENKIKQR